MSNQDGQRAELRRTSELNERRPNDAVDWRPLRALNERCLGLIVQLARSGHEHAPPAVSSNRALWCGLDTDSRQRAANSRLLLFDINFADPAWWLDAVECRSNEREVSRSGYLQLADALEFMHETMTLAWMFARVDQSQATILCGMAPRVAALFCAFSPSDLLQYSARHHGHLRLRFDDQPRYWRMHLNIASRARAADIPHRYEDRPHSLL